MSVWQDVLAAVVVAAALAWVVRYLRRGLSGGAGGSCSGCPSCGSQAKPAGLVDIELPARKPGP